MTGRALNKASFAAPAWVGVVPLGVFLCSFRRVLSSFVRARFGWLPGRGVAVLGAGCALATAWSAGSMISRLPGCGLSISPGLAPLLCGRQLACAMSGLSWVRRLSGGRCGVVPGLPRSGGQPIPGQDIRQGVEHRYSLAIMAH